MLFLAFQHTKDGFKPDCWGEFNSHAHGIFKVPMHRPTYQ